MSVDRKTFLTKFLQAPHLVGSVTPSSRFLAQAILSPIQWEQTRSVVELGAGTGSITHYINQHRRKDTQVILFEQDEQMREKLMLKYPYFHHCNEAARLEEEVRELGFRQVDVIVCGLPLTLFSEEKRHHILEEITRTLRPGGLFIAFQYTLHMKKTFKQHFQQVDHTFVPFNFPPAFVYHCSP